MLVISKTCRKSKYTISKTIIGSQSWSCVEIQDLDLHIFKTTLKVHYLDLHIFENISRIQDLDPQIFQIIKKHQDLDVHIYDFWNNLEKYNDQIL